MKIGIDLGGSHIAVGLIDKNNNIVAKKEEDITKQEKEKLPDGLEYKLIKIINQLLETKQVSMKNIDKIGVAVPGQVNKNGEVFTINLKLKDYPIKNILEGNFNVPVQIRNDAKCAGLAEKKYGSLKDYADAVFLCLGTGIGSCVFMQNNLLTSNKTKGSEIGHMIIQKDGRLCNCGKRGCFEKYAAMSAFKTEVSNLFKLKSASGDEILEIVLKERGNKELEKIIEEYIRNLAIGIINIIEIFEPEVICIGGSFVYFKEIFLEKLKQEIKKQPHFNPTIPKILLAEMGNSSGIIGSVL